MLPGLTWFAPLEEKSFCPHTFQAAFEFGGKLITRLLPLSATYRFPAGSTFTSVTVEKEPAEASGKLDGFARVEVKSACPSTFLAPEPGGAFAAKTRIRLSFGAAT